LFGVAQQTQATVRSFYMCEKQLSFW